MVDLLLFGTHTRQPFRLEQLRLALCLAVIILGLLMREYLGVALVGAAPDRHVPVGNILPEAGEQASRALAFLYLATKSAFDAQRLQRQPRQKDESERAVDL